MVRSAWTTIGVSPEERIAAVKTGLPAARVKDFCQRTGLPIEPILNVVKLTRGELDAKQQLSPEESERLWRLAAIYESSLALFEGDAERTMHWLGSPQPALENNSPLEHVVTEPGAAEVHDLIGRIEHGVLS